MADGLVGVQQAASPDRQIDNDTDGSKYRQKVWDAGPIGTWDYTAGTSGTASITTGGRVLDVVAHASSAASLTINGGASVTIPANTQFSLELRGKLTHPTIVFTGTDSYFVSWVV